MKTIAVFTCACLLPALFSCQNDRDDNGDNTGNPTGQSISNDNASYPDDSYSGEGNMQQTDESGNNYENGTSGDRNASGMADTSYSRP